jgi:hypothetical protein
VLEPEGDHVSTLDLFVLLLVCALVACALSYVAYRHPASRVPISVGIAATAALGTLVSAIHDAGPSEAVPVPAPAPATAPVRPGG